MNILTEIDGARPLAAPAPDDYDENLREDSDQDRNLDAFCEQYVLWSRTRRLFGPSPVRGSVMGQLVGGSTRPLVAVDAICSAEMAAFHIALTCQPYDSLDYKVFRAYYELRIKPIKCAAEALKISRKHFYSVLAVFRVRVWNAAQAIAEDNQVAHRATLARRVARQELAQQ